MDSPSGALIVPRLYPCSGGALPLRGAALDDPVSFAPGAVVWEGGVITHAGPAGGLGGDAQELQGGCIVPGFVDCHTHLPFFGWRSNEFAARLAGRSYRDLHGEGGIPRSARMLAEASDDEVLVFCRRLLAEMAEHGTTALELKTGYGLSVEGELRQARLARALAEAAPQTCTVTLLCHAAPSGWERAEWVRAFAGEVIPAAVAEGLADAVDIYVEDIAFTTDDLRAVAEAAHAAGLPVRCHADQLGASGAAEVAVEIGSRSADHLNSTGPGGVAALGAAEGTVAVLLPASSLMLRAAPPPVGDLVAAGAALALSTDFNPGTSPVCSMPEVVALGCSLYGLSTGVALAATTINPAWVLGMHDRLGSLEPGKRADFVVLDAEDFVAVPYRPGHNPVARAYIGGVAVKPEVGQLL